jgi:hypothetical protein
MSKHVAAIPNWQPSSPAGAPPAPGANSHQWRWWRKAKPSRAAQAAPALAITWTPPRPNYDAKLRRWRPLSAPGTGASRWRWLSASKGERSMAWATPRKRWRPQTAR